MNAQQAWYVPAALFVAFVLAPLANGQQTNNEAPASGMPVLHAETRQVLVDAVVTDKKGGYIRDLAAKDFKVWEDGKEQPIASFSFESDPASPNNSEKHYLVLFFDNSTMPAGDQAQARKAAAQFIDANAGPNRLIAVVDFGGTIHIAQNFTADAARLKQVVATVQGSAVNPNAQSPVEIASLSPTPGLPQLSNSEADFGVRSVLIALRTLAKDLNSVSGRKTLVFLTEGFPFDAERESEMTATIDACNKANVAIYPIDVRGLAAPDMSGPHSELRQPQDFNYGFEHGVSNPGRAPRLLLASFDPDPSQHGGSGGGGGGHGAPVGGGSSGGHGTTGTGTSGSHGSVGSGTTGSRGFAPNSAYNNPYNQPRQIVPAFPSSATTNQQVLYELAEGTGGFVILNTNDLLGGLQKIASEQSEYYLLGYKPPDSPEGSCHTLKVKVERGDTIVRARSGYCRVRPLDMLAGNSVEKDLESRANGSGAGNVNASMEAPYFYTAANVARVNLAIDIASSSFKFEKVKGKQHSEINVLGIAYNPDNSVAARFSDSVNLDFDGKKEVEEFQKKPYHYENQFEIAAGQYTLKVAFSSPGNERFGKLEIPLAIDPYDGKKISISGLALSDDMHRVEDLSTDLDAELLEDRKPLVVKGIALDPSGSNHFKKNDNAAVYVEIYDPLLQASAPPKVGLEFKVVDRKSGQQKMDFGVTDTASSIQAGSPVVPLGLKLPVAQLGPGSYKLELRAVDSANNETSFRTTDFDVE